MNSGLPPAASRIRDTTSAGSVEPARDPEEIIRPGVWKWLEDQGCGVPLAAAPARPTIQQIRPRDAEQE